jgi:hypothetical protein
MMGPAESKVRDLFMIQSSLDLPHRLVLVKLDPFVDDDDVVAAVVEVSLLFAFDVVVFDFRGIVYRKSPERQIG